MQLSILYVRKNRKESEKIMKKIFLDLDGTLAKFNVKNALKRFDNEIGFFAKLGAYKGIEEIKRHAWFRHFDWNNVLNLRLTPPFLPICTEDYFDES